LQLLDSESQQFAEAFRHFAHEAMNARLRSKVIAEWRGLPDRPLLKDTAKPVREPLARLMQALGLGDRLREDQVKAAWSEIVGDFLAIHSEPVALRDGTLIVRVLQPTLHYELDRVWKPRLLQKLRERFGQRTVREIKFRIG
jgi:predicted nucleic acid-binding Zn ribbon protein